MHSIAPPAESKLRDGKIKETSTWQPGNSKTAGLGPTTAHARHGATRTRSTQSI